MPTWRRPLDASWRARAVGVAGYRVEHGRLPATGSDDEAARRLGNWLHAQRRLHRAGRLAPARIAWLDLNLPDWDDPASEQWYDKAERVAHLTHDLGRLPTRGSGDDEERRLAIWLQVQRTTARQNRLPPARREWLDDALPGWDRPRESAWAGTAESVRAFRHETGRLPAARAAGDAAERRLGQWLAKQRTLREKGSLAVERAEWLDERLPGWSGDGAAVWSERLAAIVAFANEHGRLPARSATSERSETALAVWLANQRAADRHGRLSPERGLRLDLELPGWRSGRANGWRASAEAVVRFHDEHGRLPGTTDTDAESRRLGAWLARQRVAANEGRLSTERERRLRLHLPGWRSHHLNAWIATGERVARFQGEHGRLPTRRAAASPLERELGVWLNNQRTAARSAQLAHERRRWLDEQLPGWDDPRLATWIMRGSAVAQFRARVGRLPSPRASEPHARRLGAWLETQRAAHRAGTLDSRRVAWFETHLTGWRFEATTRFAAEETRLRRPVTAIEPHVAGSRRPAGSPAILDEWLARLATRGREQIGDHQLRWLDANLPGWDRRDADTPVAVAPRSGPAAEGLPRAAG